MTAPEHAAILDELRALLASVERLRYDKRLPDGTRRYLAGVVIELDLARMDFANWGREAKVTQS